MQNKHRIFSLNNFTVNWPHVWSVSYSSLSANGSGKSVSYKESGAKSLLISKLGSRYRRVIFTFWLPYLPRRETPRPCSEVRGPRSRSGLGIYGNKFHIYLNMLYKLVENYIRLLEVSSL
jgi:hypothetical protein